jgi:hypothetical protein
MPRRSDFPRERGGEHVLCMARVRSRIAKRRGDAVGDLPNRDPDNSGRVAAPAALSEQSIGGELVPPMATCGIPSRIPITLRLTQAGSD